MTFASIYPFQRPKVPSGALNPVSQQRVPLALRGCDKIVLALVVREGDKFFLIIYDVCASSHMAGFDLQNPKLTMALWFDSTVLRFGSTVCSRSRLVPSM